MTVPEVAESAMRAICDCGRPVHDAGAHCVVEFALNAHGEYEGCSYIDTLSRGGKSAQMRYYDICQRLDVYADTGSLDVPRELRKLHEHFWEIKTAKDRFPFFHHEHGGNPAIRITHGFDKSKNRTADGKIPRKQKDKVNWIWSSDTLKGDGIDGLDVCSADSDA